MAGFRVHRTNEDVLRELTHILRDVKDPRVKSTMLSIVRVEVTNDLSYATIYLSSLDGLEETKKALIGLESAKGYMRRELGSRLRLRKIPDLRFVADDSIEYSTHILNTLRSLDKDKEQTNGSNESEDNFN